MYPQSRRPRHRPEKRLAFRWAVIALAGLGNLLRAEVWKTTDGGQVEGNLSDLYGGHALIVGKGTSALVGLEHLDDTALSRVAEFTAREPAAAQTWNTSTSKVAKGVRQHLQVLSNGKLIRYDPGARPEPRLYLVYFGAHWCGPCRRFSPDLVAAYKRLKQAAPDAFELIFISNDHDSDEQALYAREENMPWPVLNYSYVGSVKVLDRWAGPGIPCLVVVSRDGEQIFNSYHGAEYVGPQLVLDQFTGLLREMLNDDSEAARRSKHRLAVLQHQREVGNGNSSVQPYLISLDRSHYQTLTAKELSAHLEIDDHGRVTDASFEPKQDGVITYTLQHDAWTWLFLPAIQAGQPKSVKVVLPLKL